jgi:hypothetical protein
LNGRFGLGDFLALNGVDPKGKETSESLASGAETHVGLHEGCVARGVEDGIAREMVRLEFVEVKKLAEEIRGGKAEAALEVSKENDELAVPKIRFDLVARTPAGYPFRYPSRPVKPVNLMLGYLRTFPGPASDAGKIYSGTLARAAGILTCSGIAFHPDALSRRLAGSLTPVAIGGRFGKIWPARHRNQRDTGFYSKTAFPRSTLERRSTSKRKSERKGRVNILPTQDLESKRKKANKHWGSPEAAGDAKERFAGEMARA